MHKIIPHKFDIAGKIAAVDSIWVLGEDFVEDSARRCFSQVTNQELFTHTKFDIKILASKSFNSCFLTTVARVRNSLAMALLNIVTPLPKMLFIMIEDDIIKELNNSNDDTIKDLRRNSPHDLILVMGRSIEWLYHEIRKLLAGHNDALPNKARKDVHLIWVLPTRHMNYANDHLREMLAGCIMNLVEVHNDNNTALPLKQNWDPYDPSIYFHDSQRYSTDGLNRLWRAFDRTVWYANNLVSKTANKRSNEQQQNANIAQRGNPYGYRGGRGYFGNKRYYAKYNKFRKQLPPPPQ